MVIKNESPESEMMEIGVENILDSSESEEKIVPDIKNIDIVWHPLCEDSIKSEIVPEDLLETKHLESVETQVYVKTENSSFVKTENIIQSENLNKTEDTCYGNGSWGTAQGVVKVPGSNKHFNASGNLETDEQLVINFSGDLKGIGTSSRKPKHPKKIDFARCYKSNETTSWENEKEKIEIIRARIILVKSHEYTSLAKDKHVCNHCKYACNSLRSLKRHIKVIHREVTTMYQCPYCPYKSYNSLLNHIILKHKRVKDIQWFQCHLCEMKFKLNYYLTRHMKKVHLTPKQMRDRSGICLDCGKRCTHKIRKKRYCCEKCAKERHMYHCDKCGHRTSRLKHLNSHKLIHLKSEEIQYFYCYHCSHKTKDKQDLKRHIFRHFRNENVPFHCYICDFMTLKRDMIVEHFKKHPEHHSKCDETNYKYQLETCIKKLVKSYHCDKCGYKTCRFDTLKIHKLTHLKPEEIQYFYCYHCSHKNKRKQELKKHIFRHFRNEDVPFHCYICDFMTLKRDMIVEHFKKHPEHHSKCDELESRIKKLEKRYSCGNSNYETYRRQSLTMHKMIHLKPEETQYFYCYHCSYKSKRKMNLKIHIFNHFKKGDLPFDCYICDFITLKRDVIIEHLKTHSKHRSKLNEPKYKYQLETSKNHENR